jgi:hypothetical protein
MKRERAMLRNFIFGGRVETSEMQARSFEFFRIWNPVKATSKTTSNSSSSKALFILSSGKYLMNPLDVILEKIHRHFRHPGGTRQGCRVVGGIEGGAVGSARGENLLAMGFVVSFIHYCTALLRVAFRDLKSNSPHL